MKERLHKLLLDYLLENNPDLLFQLQQMDQADSWVTNKIVQVESIIGSGKSGYIIEQECMEAATASLKPSKYNYLKNILEDEFPTDYQKFVNASILTFEVINMIPACQVVFDETPLTIENEDDRLLEYAVIGVMSDYLHSAE